MASREEIAARVAAQRERHIARPLIVRIGVTVGGGALGLTSLVLLIPLPEGGVPMLLIALRLLALEFDWAARSYAWVSWRWEQFRARWRSRPTWFRHGSTVLVALLTAVVIWWLLSQPFSG